jgi:hypothetical protein
MGIMTTKTAPKPTKAIKKEIVVDPLHEKVDRLFENFAAEKIIVILDKDIELTIETEEGTQSHKTPVTAQGYLTDCDDTYLYLGQQPNGINQAIHKDYIVHIEIDDSVADDNTMEIGELPKGVRGYN